MDPELRAYSPGVIFQWRAVEAMPALGLDTYELGRRRRSLETAIRDERPACPHGADHRVRPRRRVPPPGQTAGRPNRRKPSPGSAVASTTLRRRN